METSSNNVIVINSSSDEGNDLDYAISSSDEEDDLDDAIPSSDKVIVINSSSDEEDDPDDGYSAKELIEMYNLGELGVKKHGYAYGDATKTEYNVVQNIFGNIPALKELDDMRYLIVEDMSSQRYLTGSDQSQLKRLSNELINLQHKMYDAFGVRVDLTGQSAAIDDELTSKFLEKRFTAYLKENDRLQKIADTPSRVGITKEEQANIDSSHGKMSDAFLKVFCEAALEIMIAKRVLLARDEASSAASAASSSSERDSTMPDGMDLDSLAASPARKGDIDFLSPAEEAEFQKDRALAFKDVFSKSSSSAASSAARKGDIDFLSPAEEAEFQRRRARAFKDVFSESSSSAASSAAAQIRKRSQTSIGEVKRKKMLQAAEARIMRSRPPQSSSARSMARSVQPSAAPPKPKKSDFRGKRTVFPSSDESDESEDGMYLRGKDTGKQTFFSSTSSDESDESEDEMHLRGKDTGKQTFFSSTSSDESDESEDEMHLRGKDTGKHTRFPSSDESDEMFLKLRF